MDITIIKQFPIGIKAQLKRQIKTMIADNRLKAGERLLSARDMGVFLSINRNTVAAAYKELEQDGLVNIITGAGTFVREINAENDTAPLKDIFQKAYEKAVQAGFSSDKIIDYFITGLLEKSSEARKGADVILIDCTYEVLETLDRRIKDRCNINSHGMLIQNIQKYPDKFIKRARRYNFILCGMYQMEALKRAVPDLPVETIGFVVKTSFHMMNQAMQLPVGTAVGYCCVSEKSSRAVFKTAGISAGASLNSIHTGINDQKGIETMLDTCDVIFATHYVHDTLVKNFPTQKKIHCVTLDIDPENLDFIISRLEK